MRFVIVDPRARGNAARARARPSPRVYVYVYMCTWSEQRGKKESFFGLGVMND